MASHSSAQGSTSPVRVRLIDRTDGAARARAKLEAAADVTLRIGDAGDPVASDADGDDHCVLVALSDADAPRQVIDRARNAAQSTPVVALLEPGGVTGTVAIDAGATDAFRVDNDLVTRIRWLTGGAVTADRDVEAAFEGGNALGDAVCRVDTRWRVAEVTAPAADLLGRSADTFGGAHLWTLDPALRSTSFREACWRAVLSGASATETVELQGRHVAAEIIPGDCGVLFRLRDATDRAAERRALDRYERILETVDDGIYTLDENFRITGVNEAVTELTGYSREELVGAHSTLLADESVLVEAGDAIKEILLGERDSGRLEVSLETKDGRTIPAETHFSAFHSGDEGYGSVGVIRDITDRKRYERTLTALNRSTRELFRTERKPEVGQLVVETATEVLGVETVSVVLFSDEDGTLDPAAWAGDREPASIEPADGALWRSFVEGSARTIDASNRDPNTFAFSTPLGEHGLLVTAPSSDGPTGDELETLTDLLAANAVAALDRVDRASQLASRERALAQHNEELTRLNRFNTLTREVNRALVEADSRGAIERAVCERLAESPLLAFAWIGEYDTAHNSLTARAWAGAERGYLDTLPTVAADGPGGAGDGDEPSLRAARDGEAVVVDSVTAGVQQSDWRQRALSCEFLSVASVPLVYNDYSYGVLSVYATDPAAFDDATRTMFEELGVTTANAINSAQAKETLITESVVELDLRIPASNAPLRRMAEAVAGELRLEGSVPQPDGTSLLYLAVRGASRSPTAIESVAPVERVTEVTDRDGEVLLEVRVDGVTAPTRLADYGAAITDLIVDSEAIDVVVELPRGVDVRELVETLASSYPGTELLARRTREQPIETRRAFRSRLEDELTARQLDVLRTAYLSGYFEWPRERSGQDVASSIGIAQPTFARHLRIAERKLLTSLFEEQR